MSPKLREVFRLLGGPFDGYNSQDYNCGMEEPPPTIWVTPCEFPLACRFGGVHVSEEPEINAERYKRDRQDDDGTELYVWVELRVDHGGELEVEDRTPEPALA